MISTFSVSITTVGSMLSLAKKLSITRRVADPISKSTNGSAARSRGATVRRRASGCVGIVTSSNSSRITGTVTMSASSTGSVRSPASTRPARISWTEWPAIATVRRTAELYEKLSAIAPGLAMEEGEGQINVRACGCPLASITESHPEVCDLLAAVLSELLGTNVRERCQREDSPRCCFEVSKADTG